MAKRKEPKIVEEFDSSLSIANIDITGKYVVLDANVLAPRYRTMFYRIIKAESGFGCHPGLIGRAVFATGLDGETTRW